MIRLLVVVKAIKPNRKYTGVSKRSVNSSTERNSPCHPGLESSQDFSGSRSVEFPAPATGPNCQEHVRGPTSFPCALRHEQADPESDVEFLVKNCSG